MKGASYVSLYLFSGLNSSSACYWITFVLLWFALLSCVKDVIIAFYFVLTLTI